MSYLFKGLHFTSATNTWIILESLDSLDKQDAFGGKDRDWLLKVCA